MGILSNGMHTIGKVIYILQWLSW